MAFGQENDGIEHASIMKSGSTETIDLGSLLTEEITTTGSFDIRGHIWATTFGKVIQALPIPAFLVDPNRVIIAANQACSRISSDFAVILGNNFRVLFPNPTISVEFISILDEINLNRKTQVKETLLQIRDKPMWARLTFRSIRILKNRYTLVLAEDLTREKLQQKRNENLLQDLEKRVEERTRELTQLNFMLSKEIEDRLKTESALVEAKNELERKILELAKSENNFRSVFEGATDLIMLIAKNGKILKVNPAVIKSLGYSNVQLLGMDVRDFLLFSDNQYTEFEFGKTKIDLKKMIEVQLICESGSILIAELSISAIRNKMAEIVYYVFIMRDVSERKKLEERLRQTAKMEAVGQLASGIAHDFNNLLTSIMGYAELATMKTSDNHQRNSMKQIIQAANKAADLTKQLLAFGRKQMLSLQLIDLNSLVKNIRDILDRLIRENIMIETCFDESEVTIYGDPNEIEQILVNLVVNARDSIEETGVIRITTSNLILQEQYEDVPPGEYVVLSLADSGQGIPAHLFNRIFEPFFTTKAKGTGTGLGLATVYGIIKQHQGYISVQSQVNQGTTFRVFFPKQHGNVPELRAETVSTEIVNGFETILLVEDEELVRYLAKEGLEMLGYKVLEAAEPHEALKVCSEYKDEIHLLLTDIVLPNMNGLNLYSEVAEMRPAIKVLFMSGYPDDAFIGHPTAMDHGKFLRKPFALDTLSREVREVIGG